MRQSLAGQAVIVPTRENLPSARQHRTLVVAFAIYLMLLVWGVLWKFTVPWIGAAAGLPHPFKLIPFVPDGVSGASAPLEVLANVLLFVPFGVYLAVLAPAVRWWIAGGIVLGTSLVLELAQPIMSTGGFDTSDLIANTAGGLVGMGVLAFLGRGRARGFGTVVTRVLVIGTVVWLVGIAVFIASPLRYAPQPDVVVQL